MAMDQSCVDSGRFVVVEPLVIKACYTLQMRPAVRRDSLMMVSMTLEHVDVRER